METIIASWLANPEKIGVLTFFVVATMVLIQYSRREQTARIDNTAAQNKANADAHDERMANSTLLTNQLLIGNKQATALDNVTGVLTKVGEGQAALQASLADHASVITKDIKSTLDAGVRLKMGMMQINSVGEVVLINHDAMSLLGFDDTDLIKGRQFQTLGLKMTDTDDNVFKDLAALPFGAALTSGILDNDTANIRVQRLDKSWTNLMLSMLLVDGDEVKKKQVLITFIDIGELENLAPGTTASTPA